MFSEMYSKTIYHVSILPCKSTAGVCDLLFLDHNDSWLYTLYTQKLTIIASSRKKPKNFCFVGELSLNNQ